MEQTECSETSAYKLQTPGNYPKESIQHIIVLLGFHLSIRFLLIPKNEISLRNFVLLLREVCR